MSNRKSIVVGRVKGSMIYSGTNHLDVEKPLEQDLYFNTEDLNVYQYIGNIWKVRTDLKDYFTKIISDEKFIVPTQELDLGLSNGQYDISSDDQILTTKATYELINDGAINAEEIPIVEADEISIGKSNNYNVDSNREIPTTKAVYNIVMNNKPIKVSELENDSEFINNSVNNLVNYFTKEQTKEYFNQFVGSTSSLKFMVVSSLPTTNINETTIYLVPISNKKENNIYEEYIYINNNWESLGTTQVNLTGYATENFVENEFSKEREYNSNTFAQKTDVPTKTSQLTNDAGYLIDYTETDPTVPTHVKNITQSDIDNWNSKSTFSGSYNDLTNKPTIPTKVSQLENDKNFISKEYIDEAIANAITNVLNTEV